QFGLIADTGVQENLRRVYRSQRQNHLAPGTNATGASFMRNLDAGGSPALESQPGNQRMREYREVWLVHVREDIRPEDGFALSIANAHIGGGRTTIGLHDAAVLISKIGIPSACMPSNKARTADVDSCRGWTNTGPPVPRYRGSGVPCQSSMRR